MALDIAEKAMKITQTLGIPYVFKGSYRKANRSRMDSFTGIGDEKALRILRKVGETFKIPVVTDIHEPVEADIAAEYVDVPSDRIAGSCCPHGPHDKHQERSVPRSRVDALCRTKGTRCR